MGQSFEETRKLWNFSAVMSTKEYEGKQLALVCSFRAIGTWGQHCGVPENL